MLNKLFIYAVCIASWLPVIMYPGVLMAGLMSLAAPIPKDASLLTLSVAQTAIWLSLVYPFAMLVCWGTGLTLRNACLALGYLALCLTFFALWYVLSVK